MKNLRAEWPALSEMRRADLVTTCLPFPDAIFEMLERSNALRIRSSTACERSKTRF